MCLVVFAWRAHPAYPLVVAANRDEYFERPAAPAHWWTDAPELLAGRDLEAGGTWMGLARNGRFAALTNYRDPSRRAHPLCRLQPAAERRPDPGRARKHHRRGASP